MAPHDVDLVSGLLWEQGVVAIEEVTGPAPHVLLRTSPADPEAMDGLVASVATLAAVLDHRVVAVDDADWLDAWRDHARPRPAGRRLWIEPSWLVAAEPVPPGRIVVRVDPGRTFGSGSHASTRLALTLLEGLVDHATPPARVLDVGCGSGVLGIAALLLGADRLRAIDVDPAAAEATTANAADNGVAERTRADTTPLGELAGHHDLVLANILAPVLVEMAHGLVARTAPDGRVVLAGFLEEQEDDVLAALDAAAVRAARSVEPLARCAEDGWSAVALTVP